MLESIRSFVPVLENLIKCEKKYLLKNPLDTTNSIVIIASIALLQLKSSVERISPREIDDLRENLVDFSLELFPEESRESKLFCNKLFDLMESTCFTTDQLDRVMKQIKKRSSERKIPENLFSSESNKLKKAIQALQDSILN